MIARCWECNRPVEECACVEFVECLCVRIDVDQDDASNCPAHGPHSALARRQLEREAAGEAAYWRGWKPFFEGDNHT